MSHLVRYSVSKPHRKDLNYDLAALLEAAHAAKNNSYSPYSKFRVGAAVVAKNGKIFSGCNVESCSYGLTNCAERVTLQNAVGNGLIEEMYPKRKADTYIDLFHAIAITSDLETFIKPCGACRQVMAEFGQYDVLLTSVDGTYVVSTVRDLLPAAFVPLDLSDGGKSGPQEEWRPMSPVGPMVSPRKQGEGALEDLEMITERRKV